MTISPSAHRRNRYLRIGFKLLLCGLLLVLLRSSPVFATPTTLVSLDAEGALIQTLGSEPVVIEGEPEILQTLAVDRERGLIWFVGDTSISVHDVLGTKLWGSALLDVEPNSERSIAIASDGSAWLAGGKDLWNFGLGGQLLQKRPLDRAVIDLDVAGSELWVASAGSVVSLDARSGAQLRQLAESADLAINAMTVVRLPPNSEARPQEEPRYELWVSSGNSLLRFDDGAVASEIELPFFNTVERLADDGAGGLWLTAGTHLGHVAPGASHARIRPPFNDSANSKDTDAVDSVAITALAIDGGSAWIAGGNSLRQISLLGWTLESTTGARPITDLAIMTATVDDLAPTLAIDLPMADQIVKEARPELRFSYSDDGRDTQSGILEGSLEILTGGVKLAAGCAYDKAQVRCRPNTALPEGEIILEATISDIAGNRSDAVTRVFTVDTDRSDDGETGDGKPPESQGGAGDTVYTPVVSPRGFRPNQPYQLGEIDAVDTASGNVTFRVPLGQVYEVGPMISYQIQAVNNSNAWDHVPIRCDNPSSCELIPGGIPTFSLPNAASNAGLGWEVHFGKLFSPQRPSGLDGINWDRWPNTNMDPSDDNQRWMYVAPDGARYYLYSLVGRSNGSGNTIKRYSKDGSFLRLSQINANTAHVEFPDGRYSVFEKVGNVSAGTEFCGNGVSGCWRFKEMLDPFGNKVSVSYSITGNNEDWSVSDSTGRATPFAST